MTSHLRRRLSFAAFAIAVVPIGLATRRFPWALPELIATYAGDALWAMTVYLLIGALAPTAPIRIRATISLAFAFLVECSQLWHPAWLDAIRATTAGRLVLGQGFLWSDLACYSVGVAIAAAVESLITRPAPRRHRTRRP